MSIAETGYQPRLNLQLSARTVLVGMEAVRLSRGVDSESVLAEIDNGKLRFVFDIGHSPDPVLRRGLRFWRRELIEPAAVVNLTMTEAINQIVGDRKFFRRNELVTQWVTNRMTIKRLVQNSEVKLNGTDITADSLREFLHRRVYPF